MQRTSTRSDHYSTNCIWQFLYRHNDDFGGRHRSFTDQADSGLPKCVKFQIGTKGYQLKTMWLNSLQKDGVMFHGVGFSVYDHIFRYDRYFCVLGAVVPSFWLLILSKIFRFCDNNLAQRHLPPKKSSWVWIEPITNNIQLNAIVKIYILQIEIYVKGYYYIRIPPIPNYLDKGIICSLTDIKINHQTI